MTKIIRLTESDLVRIIGKVINEQPQKWVGQNLVRPVLNLVRGQGGKQIAKTTPTVAKEFASQVLSLKPQYIQRFGQSSYDDLIKKYKSGSIDHNTLIKTLSSASQVSPELAKFVTKYGIKFTQNEITEMNKISRLIRYLPETINKFIFKKINFTIPVQTTKGLKNIDVKLMTSEEAPKMWGDDFVQFGFARGDEITLIIDNLKREMDPRDIELLLYHEIAHVKDPAIVKSSKLSAQYKATPEYFSKSYFFHPWELSANQSMILQKLSSNTKNMMGKLFWNKQRTLKGLEDIINWCKRWQFGPELTDDAEKLIGLDQPNVKDYFYDMELFDSNKLRNLKAKIAQQAEYLKSQVNLSLKEQLELGLVDVFDESFIHEDKSIDQILDKIGVGGMGSLSSKERRTLYGSGIKTKDTSDDYPHSLMVIPFYNPGTPLSNRNTGLKLREQHIEKLLSRYNIPSKVSYGFLGLGLGFAYYVNLKLSEHLEDVKTILERKGYTVYSNERYDQGVPPSVEDKIKKYEKSRPDIVFEKKHNFDLTMRQELQRVSKLLGMNKISNYFMDGIGENMIGLTFEINPQERKTPEDLIRVSRKEWL